jgi:hypothetical protein
MDLLIELIGIVDRNKVRSINIIGDENFSADTNLNKLYNGILSGEITTDEDAMKEIGLLRKTKRFHNLKSELKQRLLNTLFFIDVNKPGFTDLSGAYYTCCRRWVAVKIMFGRGAFNTGMDMAKKLFNKTIEYEFTEISMDLARLLSSQYGFRYGDRERFNHYNEAYDKLAACFHAENILDRHFSSLVMYRVHKEGREKFLEVGEELEKEIPQYLERFDTYRVHLCGRIALIWCALNAFEYRKTIELCDSGVLFFKSKSYVANTPMGMFLHYKMICHTQLREFVEGRETAEFAKEYYEEGTPNYFKFQESLFILEMHTRHYEKAYMIYYTITNLKKFKKMAPRSRETWLLYGAFLEYLIIVGALERPLEAEKKSLFRLNRFLNEVPIFNGEKRRRNIPVLVLQTLFLINRDRYSAAADRIEAIEKYCSRYLKKGTSFRSNCFIKMLLQVPQTAFHVEAVKRKASRYFKKLESTPLEVTNQSWEVEIIPYEQLWEFTLDSLSPRRISSR